jgi:CRISPR-associated protein Cmx8
VGRAEENLLLHFWPLAVLLFVPQSVESDGETDFVGCTLAVPDVANLTEFVSDYPKLLAALSKHARGYRPAQAVIVLPAEGALAFLDDLTILTGLQVESGELRFSIGAIEYLHLHKPPKQNNVKLMTAGRVAPNRRLLSGYRAIVSPKDESTRYRNPLFRRRLLAALFDDVPWYRPFGRTFLTFDEGVFVRQPHKADDEKGPPQFATDAAKKFRHEAKVFSEKLTTYEDMPESARVDTPRPKPKLPVIVNRVVYSYLLTLTEAKSGCSLDKYRDSQRRVQWDTIPSETLETFNEAKRKIAESLFLEFRSRKDQEFVDLFASRMFSAKQYLTEDERLELAAVLMNSDKSERRDDLKTLVLLSLSAN